MMLVELAPLWKLGLGGMPLAPLVQILVILRTIGNAGSSQNQLRKKVSGKLSRTRPLTLQYKGRNTLGGNRIKGVFRGTCQPKGDQLDQGHIAKLAEFALSQPQACYTANTFGLKHRWTYFLTSLPDIQDLLESLENVISHLLIPAITERKCNQLDRNILAPVRDIPSTCACGEAFTVDHSMICKLGDFITQCHNELRDLEAEFLSMVCSDAEIEPVLQDISGEHLNRGSNKAQDAKLDIRARGFWERHQSAFFDMGVCNPNAVSYRDLEPQQIYRIHENEKKLLYSKSPGHRAWNIGLHHNWRNGKGVLDVS